MTFAAHPILTPALSLKERVQPAVLRYFPPPFKGGAGGGMGSMSMLWSPAA